MIWYPEKGDRVVFNGEKGVIIGWQTNPDSYNWLVKFKTHETYLRQIDLKRYEKGLHRGKRTK